LRELPVLLFDIGIDLLVVETGESRSDSVALSHLEVLSEVLITAPPVGPDHIQALVTAGLMEVGVADVVLLSIDGESTISVRGTVLLADLTKSVPPVLDHTLLLYIVIIHN
jgi:hypothetical protein